MVLGRGYRERQLFLFASQHMDTMLFGQCRTGKSLVLHRWFIFCLQHDLDAGHGIATDE